MQGEGATVIRQRSIVGGPTFHFHAEHLDYCGIECGFRTKYEDIPGPGHYRRIKTSDRLVQFTAAYFAFLLLVLILRDQHPHIGPEGWHWFVRVVGGFVAVAAAICGALYWAMHKEYTVVPARNGGILVVRDRQHDVIIAKLQACRLDGLRRLAAPDPANSPEEELAKLKWLRDEGAISDDEYRHFSAGVAT
jgi:hypothetical protein